MLRFFTDPERFAAWFGPGSTIDPVPGGKFRVVYPGGQAAAGEVVELDARRIVLTWGVEGDPDLPPGASTIEVTLTAADGGTRVRFVQTGLPDEGRRAGQAAGFTHALAVLAAQSAGAEVQPGAERLADQVTAAFNTDDGPPRLELLEACWAETGTFRDPQANVAGRAALDAHIANARRFAAGANLVRGAVVVSHRELLWPWRIEGADGAVWAAGTNHAAVDPDGRIAAMTGFWDVGGGR